jgi:hypothetical protein
MSESKTLQISMMTRIHGVVFGNMILCSVEGGINVSEENIASIFRVEENQAGKVSGYIRKVER